MMASLKRADLRGAWERAWLKGDYSWDGLAKKPTPPGGVGPNLQAFLRSLSGDFDDEALIEKGILYKCKGGRLFHVLYIPAHWKVGAKVDDENFLEVRSKILESYGAKCRKIENYPISGMSFYNGDNNGFLHRIRHFNQCYISSSISPAIPNAKMLLRGTFVDGSVQCNSEADADIDLDVTHSFIAGSIAPNARSGRSVKLAVKGSRISEALKLLDLEVQSLILSHSTIGSISVKSCSIRHVCEISNVNIQTGLTFDASDFGGQVNFSETEISNHARFIDCDFEDRVVFRDVRWPIDKLSSAFTTGSRFKELVTFTSRETPPIKLFNGGTFESNVGFDSRYDGRWKDAFDAELASHHFDKVKAEILASKLEVAARNLRNLAHDRSDGPMEHFWHRAEIIARRETSSVSRPERFASKAYGWLADYGLSIEKPFAWLLALILLQTCVYGYLGGDSWYGPLQFVSLEQGLGYSLHQSFPLGVFDDFEEAWMDRLLGPTFSLQFAGVRLLATAQTVASAILIFLGVMAVRRKFKIS